MYFYRYKDKLLISEEIYTDLEIADEKALAESDDIIYALYKSDPKLSRRSFCVSDPSLLFIKAEGLEILKKKNSEIKRLPNWLLSKIESRNVMAVNTMYPGWEKSLEFSLPDKWRINIIGLGDVGSTLALGLRISGKGTVSSIGLYDRDESKIKRLYIELNQIMPPFEALSHPEAVMLSDESLFDCDMFVFCVSAKVPEIGSKVEDVRMAQYESNSKIIKIFAKMARERRYKGIFAVVSDPVDLLCKTALLESNKDILGNYDFLGLSPEQIRGYGLGVMNARAVFYAKNNPKTLHYINEGRVFGPHGKDLIIADSIENYDEELSLELTEKVKNANMDVRALGYKPYLAPALSSGSFSIIATIKNEWHYSATYMGGVYMGAKNRLTKTGCEVEALELPEPLWKRLNITYKKLGEII